MMPLGHTLTANAVAVRMKNVPQLAFAVFLTALCMHFFLLDVLPHIEPNLFGVDYLDPRHWTFYWTVVELLVSSLLTLRLFVRLPEHRTALVAGFIGAMGPDVLEALVKIFQIQELAWVSALHSQMHWLNHHLPKIWTVLLGTLTTLIACWIGVRSMPKPVPHRKSEEVPATAVVA